MAVKYDAILGKLRSKDIIPQLDSDPSSPKAQDAWILASTTMGVGGGEPYGLLLALTQPGVGGSSSYQFSYKTKEGTIIRASLS